MRRLAENRPANLIRVMPAEEEMPICGKLHKGNRMPHKLLEEAADALRNLRKKRPLVLCLTNSVVTNWTANCLLALGASPVMVEEPEEAAFSGGRCHALLVNTGTLTATQGQAMLAAVDAAEKNRIPWVLDPVAYGALPFRTRWCDALLEEHRPQLLRGNASEIACLAGQGKPGKGVDATTAEGSGKTALAAARRCSCAVLMTGETDYLAVPAANWPVFSLKYGHPLLQRTTGTGCAQGAIGAAFLSVAAPPAAALATALAMGLAGEKAAGISAGPGSFQTALLDALSQLSQEDFLACSGTIAEVENND